MTHFLLGQGTWRVGHLCSADLNGPSGVFEVHKGLIWYVNYSVTMGSEIEL